MKPSRTLSAFALAAILLAAAGPALGAGHGHADAGHEHAASARDYGADWSSLKADLKAGDVAAGRATWDAAFAAGAAEHAVAASYADAAFAKLETLAEDPASAAYKANVQIVDKATYAVAYANVRAYAAAGDAANASAWFGVLSAKFSKETDLAGAKAAFAGATDATIADAVATLDAEYSDLIQGKVMKEAAEAPDLMAGDPVKAAEEAAEALGYYLSIQADVTSALGADADASARADMEALLDAVLTGDDAAAADLAAAVRSAAGRFALATASAAKADAYSTYASAMKADKDLVAARAQYDAAFADAAVHAAPDAHARVLAAFDAAQAALDAGDEQAFQIQRQILEKSTYEIALEAFEHEALEGETDEALEFYLVLVKKFKWADDPAEGAVAAGRLAAADKLDDADLAAAQAEAYAAFFGKVREEVEEVFIHWDDPATSAIKAIEGVVYYAPLRQDVSARLGDAVGEEIARELDELLASVQTGDRSAAEHAAEEIEKLLVQYEADGAEVTETGAIVSSLKGKIEFVAEEYLGYYEAKAIGDETEAAVEMGEAKAFLAGARKQFTDNVAAFEAVDAAKVETVLANFDRIAVMLENLEPLEDVEALVTEQVTLLQTFTASSDQPEYEGTVDVVLGNAEVTGLTQFTVPVTLVGLPADGAAFQLKIEFDATAIEATEVDVTFGDVKAHDIQNENGFVRFNAASVSASDAEEQVATITFRVKTVPAAPLQLTVEAEELADAKNRPYELGSVEGGLITVGAASVETVVEENERATPLPAIGAAIGLAGAALVAARRRREA